MSPNFNNIILPQEASGHFQWLDWVRLLAALEVCVGHGRGFFLPAYGDLPSAQQNFLTFVAYSLTRLPDEAVIVFFVLSGFLEGGKCLTKQLEGRFDGWSFAWGRFVRLWVPFFAAMVFYLLTAALTGMPVDWRTWWGNLFFLQGIVVGSAVEPFWYLPYVVWFSVGLLGMGLLIQPRQRWKRYGGYGLLVLSAFVFLRLRVWYLFIILFGVAGYFLLPIRFKWPWGLALCMAIASACALSLLSFTSLAFPGIPKIPYEASKLLFGGLLALGIAWLSGLKPSSPRGERFEHWGTRLAAPSYTLYLVHVPIFRVLQHWGLARGANIGLTALLHYTLAIGIVFIVAYVLYWCVEKRTTAWRNFARQKA